MSERSNTPRRTANVRSALLLAAVALAFFVVVIAKTSVLAP